VAALAPAPPLPVTEPDYTASYLKNPQPAYPPESSWAKEQGLVTLRVLVSTAGEADEVQIHTSSGYSRLDEAARDAVRHWKFIPAKRGNEPVAKWALVPIQFKLKK
jgi:protein TonB